MSQQVVLMTGSSSGIGLSTAERLARDPDQRFLLIATVISLAEKDDLVAAVGDGLDKRVFIKELDISSDENISAVVESVINEHGRIDILLNIAGIQMCGLVESISRTQLETVLNVNTVGPIRLAQKVIPHMKRRKAGKLITVSSLAGRRGIPYHELYCASKFALEGFFEAFAHVARDFNIWTCLVEPGPICTTLLDDIIETIAKVATDESTHAIDCTHARLWSEATRKKFPALTTSDVVVKIMKCIEEEKPSLRHLVIADDGRELAEALSDLTGEVGFKFLNSVSPINSAGTDDVGLSSGGSE